MHHVLQANISAMTQNDTSHSEQPASSCQYTWDSCIFFPIYFSSIYKWNRVTHMGPTTFMPLSCHGGRWRHYVRLCIMPLSCHGGRWRHYVRLCIMPLSCHGGRWRHYVRLCTRPFVRPLPHLWKRRSESEWTDLDANWYEWSMWQRHETTFGVRRSKVKVTWRQNRSQKSLSLRFLKNYAWNFNQTWQAHITANGHCHNNWTQVIRGQSHEAENRFRGLVKASFSTLWVKSLSSFYNYATAAYAAHIYYVFALSVVVCPSHLLSQYLFCFARILDFTKFVGGNQYHEQITLWAELEQEQGSRIWQKIWIDVNQFCCHVKQVLTPSEWIHKFTAQMTADAITNTILC